MFIVIELTGKNVEVIGPPHPKKEDAIKAAIILLQEAEYLTKEVSKVNSAIQDLDEGYGYGNDSSIYYGPYLVFVKEIPKKD